MGEGSPFYPVFNDFGRFICSEAEIPKYVRSAEEANQLSQVPACMQVRERLLRDGDSDVRDLVSETVETVSSCAREQDIKKWAGPEVLAVWNKQRTQFAGNRVGYLTISSGPEMRLARFLSLLRLYLPSLALGWKSHATGEKRTRNPHSVLGVV